MVKHKSELWDMIMNHSLSCQAASELPSDWWIEVVTLAKCLLKSAMSWDVKLVSK